MNDDYFVALDIPGLNQGEVKITALGRDLTLEGIPMDAKEQNEGAETEQMANPKFTYFHRERNHRAFHRVIRFPFEVDVEHVAGHLEAGVLTIRVPKAASAKPRKIDIQTR